MTSTKPNCLATKLSQYAFLVAFLALVLRGGFALGQESQGSLEYEVNFERAQNHYVDIALKVPTKGREEVELVMATWTPGSYLIREYSRNIDTLTAENAKGESIAVTKLTKNRWKLEPKETESVTVKYRLYCREVSVRTNFVDSEYAVLNGAPTFVTVDGMQSQAHHVKVNLPDGWNRAVSALDVDENSATLFHARDFDHLVDSPIVVGNPTVHPFNAGDKQHMLVILGDDGLWNGDQAAKDVAKIVAEHQEMWDVIPYRRYLFLTVAADSGGGLEHDESTLILTGRWTFRTPNSYRSWLGTVSHEFFHAWNIRTLRPKALVEYDYEAENYFPSLWIAEGVTSYYDDLAMMRASISNQDRYLSGLSRTIGGVESTPGRLVQSLADSSHDAWIKYYRPDEHSRDSQINYYTKGSLVAFLLDAHIRKLTDDAKSLDDVMRKMYTDYSGDRGYLETDFRKVASDIAGEDLTEWFADYVDSTKDLDYSEALEWYGLRFDRPERARDSSEPGPTWTGWSVQSSDGQLKISGLTPNSPAYDAGFNLGDELIAIDGFRLDNRTLDRVLDRYEPDDIVEVMYARKGKVRSIKFALGSRTSLSWTLKPIKDATDEQKAHLSSWLHLPKPVKKEEDK